MIKKTIILADDNKSNKTLSTLTLEKSGRAMTGKIKLFGAVPRDNRYVLGIAVEGKQVLKQNVNFVSGDTYSFRFDSVDLSKNIACVLVQDNEEHTPVVWGSTAKVCGYKSRIMSFLSTPKKKAIDRRDQVPEVCRVVASEQSENASPDLSELFELPSESELDTIVEQEVAKHDVLPIFEEEMENLKDGDNFFESIKDQIDDIFLRFPPEQNLEGILPESKWVKVKYEDGSKEFVLGLIYEDGVLKYVAYGVEGEYSDEAPEGLMPYSQWLPLDIANPKDKGYWVVYQDAESGDNIPIES